MKKHILTNNLLNLSLQPDPLWIIGLKFIISGLYQTNKPINTGLFKIF